MDCDIVRSSAFEELISWDNLYHASQKAAKGKRSKVSVANFAFRLAENLIKLQQELAQGTYKPSAYAHFYIHEPKRRLISAAKFRDRVVHHALCNLIEPRFESQFSPRSFANRKGKGTHRAIRLCQSYCRRYRYALRLDIQKHFHCIDHEILKDILFRRIPEPEIRELIELILAVADQAVHSEYLAMDSDDLLSCCMPRGLPIGNFTSQFWSNCYLHNIDQFLDRQSGCKAWIRYVDDFVLFSDSKEDLWKWKHELLRRLAKLRLLIHEGSAQVSPTIKGVPWLGVVVAPAGCHIKSRKVRYSSRRLRRKARECRAGKCCFSELGLRVKSWRAYIDLAVGANGLAKTVFSREAQQASTWRSHLWQVLVWHQINCYKR